MFPNPMKPMLDISSSSHGYVAVGCRLWGQAGDGCGAGSDALAPEACSLCTLYDPTRQRSTGPELHNEAGDGQGRARSGDGATTAFSGQLP
jgi:hypothetical protein